jgi:hypothetical protein
MTTLQSGGALSMSRVEIGPESKYCSYIELSHIDGAETSVSRCSLDRLNTVSRRFTWLCSLLNCARVGPLAASAV